MTSATYSIRLSCGRAHGELPKAESQPSIVVVVAATAYDANAAAAAAARIRRTERITRTAL